MGRSNWGLRSGAEYAGAGALVFEHAGYVGSVADPADGVSVAVGAGDSCASTSGCAASGYDYGCADAKWLKRDKFNFVKHVIWFQCFRYKF